MSSLSSVIRILAAISAVAFLLLKTSCSEDSIVPLTLVSLDAGGVNLIDGQNEATVAINSPISATFSTDIDPSTVTDTTITMIREYDQSKIPLVLIVSRSTLSIKSTVDLLPGAFYTLSISGLESTHDQALSPITVTFKTTGTFVAPGLKAYWNFENNVTDIIGSFDPNPSLDVFDITFVPSRNAEAGKAASFNGTTSIIQIPGASALLSAEFTMSFWMQLNSTGHVDSQGKKKSSYVVGMGNIHGLGFIVDSTYESVVWNNGYLLADKETTMTSEFRFMGNGIIGGTGIEEATTENAGFGSAGIAERFDNTWAHVAMSFQDTVNIRSLYINGVLVYQQNLMLLDDSPVDSLKPLATVFGLKFIPDTEIPATYDDKLAFGFWQSVESIYGEATDIYSNHDAFHFQGLLDDIRIFTRTLTAEEVRMMYEDEKP